MKMKEWRGNLLLLVTAIIWGSAFVAQSVAADLVGTFTFQALRSLLGGLVLVPVVAGSALSRRKRGVAPTGNRRTLWCGGILCGVMLCVASCLQQGGIAYTTVGNAGFITAMYILLVPLLGLFFGKKVGSRLWICTGMAIVALYLLSIKDGFHISKGDLLMLACALAFSVHILLVDHFSPKVDGVQLACIQFFVAGLLPLPLMLFFERPTVTDLTAAWLPIAYAGVLSSGVGYTFQILGQKYTKPSVASLLMSLESVFAVLAAALILHQVPTLRETLGCVLMFAAIILAQLPERSRACDQNG